MAASNLAKRWGIFSNLRSIQDRRIRSARLDAKLEKSPAGVSLNPVATRLFELFFVEEFETLESGLRRLFHGAAKHFSGDEFLEDFKSTGLSLDITSTQRLGRIYRKEAKVLPIAPIARLDLPEEYEHLEVWIRKPYPSIYVLIIDAVFSEKGRAAWNRFKAEEVLPDFELAGWLPWLSHGSSEKGLWLTKQRRLVAWTDRHRLKIERLLERFLPGHWSDEKRSDRRLCLWPAMEIYNLEGAPIEHERFANWLENASLWFDSHAINLTSTFYDQDYLISLNRSCEFSDAYVATVIGRSENIQSGAHPIHAGLSANQLILEEMEGMIGTLSDIIVTDALLYDLQKRVEQTRPIVFKDLAPRKRLKGLINLSLVLEAVALQFDRLRIEWENSRKYLRFKMTAFSSFHIDFRGVKADFGPQVDAVLLARFKRLNQQLSYLQEAVGRYLEIKSAASNAWFQWGALIVGGLSLIVGILSILLVVRTAAHP